MQTPSGEQITLDRDASQAPEGEIAAIAYLAGQTTERNAMQTLRHSPPSLTRQDLEDAWRVRCEMASERYETASRVYRKLLDEKPEGLSPGHDAPLALARHAESEALAEYTRILKLFTELIVHGRIPEEQVAPKANGGRG